MVLIFSMQARLLHPLSYYLPGGQHKCSWRWIGRCRLDQSPVYLSHQGIIMNKYLGRDCAFCMLCGTQIRYSTGRLHATELLNTLAVLHPPNTDV